MNKKTKIIIGAASALVGIAATAIVGTKLLPKASADVLKSDGFDVTEETINLVQKEYTEHVGLRSSNIGGLLAIIAFLSYLVVDQVKTNKRCVGPLKDELSPMRILSAISGFLMVGGGLILITAFDRKGGANK